MQTKLSHIVSIQTGLFAKTMVDGDIAYLQSKDFDDNDLLKDTLEPELKAEKIAEKHLLKPGDVLFASKGTKILRRFMRIKIPRRLLLLHFLLSESKMNSRIKSYQNICVGL